MKYISFVGWAIAEVYMQFWECIQWIKILGISHIPWVFFPFEEMEYVSFLNICWILWNPCLSGIFFQWCWNVFAFLVLLIALCLPKECIQFLFSCYGRSRGTFLETWNLKFLNFSRSLQYSVRIFVLIQEDVFIIIWIILLSLLHLSMASLVRPMILITLNPKAGAFIFFDTVIIYRNITQLMYYVWGEI